MTTNVRSSMYETRVIKDLKNNWKNCFAVGPIQNLLFGNNTYRYCSIWQKHSPFSHVPKVFDHFRNPRWVQCIFASFHEAVIMTKYIKVLLNNLHVWKVWLSGDIKLNEAEWNDWFLPWIELTQKFCENRTFISTDSRLIFSLKFEMITLADFAYWP